MKTSARLNLLSTRVRLLLLTLLVPAGLALYYPALRADFFSDDFHYLVENRYVHELTAKNLAAYLEPAGAVAKMTQNFAPVHLLLHAAEWQVFGRDPLGYRVVNILVHAIAAVLFVSLLQASRAPPLASFLGGALFFLHPAHVEAVAWVSQLKTTGALALALAALLLHRRHPVWGAVFFALALLTKPTAAIALPVAIAWGWVRSRDPEGAPFSRRSAWTGLAVWAALLLGFAWIELPLFHYTNLEAAGERGPWSIARTVPSLGLRYLVMAASSYGISAFQEPPLGREIGSSWWIGSLVVLGLLGARTLWSLIRRREEAIYWVWAAASFFLVSQIFAFRFAMADRYLYFILPGLIGGSILAVSDRIARNPSADTRRRLGVALCLGATVLLAIFAMRTNAQARVWSLPARIYAQAAWNFPGGIVATRMRAQRAAAKGDAEETVAALRILSARGDRYFEHLVTDPTYRLVRGDPLFDAFVTEQASWWIENQERLFFAEPTWIELRHLAHAHMVRREYREAAALIERALEQEGTSQEVLDAELDELRRALARETAD